MKTPRRQSGTSRRRGFSLAEVTVACVLSTLLVATIAVFYSGFTHAALLIIARADLANEANLSIAQLAEDLRTAKKLRFFEDTELKERRLEIHYQLIPTVPPIDPVTYTLDVDPASTGYRHLRREGVAVAYHVSWLGSMDAVVNEGLTQSGYAEVTPTDPNTPQVPYEITLRFELPGVIENRSTGQLLERESHLLGLVPVNVDEGT